jgi:hypothetical protein
MSITVRFLHVFVYFYFSFISYLVNTLFGRNKLDGASDFDVGKSELVSDFDVENGSGFQ